MEEHAGNISEGRQKTVLMWMVGAGIAAIVISLALYGVFAAVSPASLGAGGAWLALVASLIIAVPLAFVCGRKAEQLNLLRNQIQKLGRSDSVTACLNDRTFSALVDTYSNRGSSQAGDPLGTILLIHVEDLQVVSRRFGYSWGNQALGLLADGIRNSVRAGDIIGRLSGDRFGVFLPGATADDARNVAQRIRQNVEALQFYPEGTRFPLSVTAGSVTVATRTSFDNLLREAEDVLGTVSDPEKNWISYKSLSQH
jgi:diguanylate cyclase (GGDEF)-like protein